MSQDHAEVQDHAQLKRDVRGRETRKVAVVSGVVNLFLSLAQIAIGLLANSAALVADGIHSASDLLSDVLVWFASRHAAQAPDKAHPYGHARFETAATLGLGVILMLVALGIVINGFERLLDTGRPVPGALALVVAAGGILAKESLYWYTIAVSRRLKSELLRANAWHHRSDALSSVVVLIGVGGAVLGFTSMDALAAIVVGVMVAKIGWDLAWGAMTELVDTALDDDQVSDARNVITAIDGVRSVHMLRTRRHGSEASADVHVLVAPNLSVSEGHMISQAVEDQLVDNIEAITDVTVHIDPEDDEEGPNCRGLPLRADVIGRLERAWQNLDLPQQRQYRLHYLGGRVQIEVVLSLDAFSDQAAAMALRQALNAALHDQDWAGSVRVLYG